MFSKATFKFLEELSINNKREWFEENKARYESLIREPALDFIEDMADELEKFAPHFRADARKMGGSLMRIYRDTRFSRVKTPYKTNIGIQFRHELGKDVHAPGFYLHIANDECFLAVGCWHPESEILGKIRDRIAESPEKWFMARDDKKFTNEWLLDGDSLTRPPRGFAADHVAIEDIKRKDFVGLLPLTKSDILSTELVQLVSAKFSQTVPFMRFLCEAIGVQY